MRTQILKGFSAAFLIGVLTVLSVPVHAAEMRVRIPFGFNVGGKALPPGTYLASSGVNGSLLVRSRSDGAFAGITRLSGKNTTPKFVFHRYGELYVLRQVWMAGAAAFEIPQTRPEREAIRAATEVKAATLERIEVPVR